MYVIKLKNKDLFLQRKPAKLVALQKTIAYRSENAAKIALKAASYYELPDRLHLKMDDFEIKEVLLKII